MEVAAELQDLIREDLVSTSTAGQEGQGGGASGHTLYKNALRGQAQVTLIQSGDKLLNGYHAKARQQTLSATVSSNHAVTARLLTFSIAADHEPTVFSAAPAILTAATRRALEQVSKIAEETMRAQVWHALASLHASRGDVYYYSRHMQGRMSSVGLIYCT